MIKLLIGGSPCTYWSIAQKNGRETEAKGLGWELFKNYIVAKEKFKPDYFLYENNKSAAQAIKDQIKHELKVYDGTLFMEDSGARYIEINSALVSAQNRQRFYVHNCGEVEQPKDRGILLKDILETTVAEPINATKDGKAIALKAQYQKDNVSNYVVHQDAYGYKSTGVAEPIRVGALPRPNGELSTSQAMRVYSVDGKSVTQSAGGGGMGGKTGLYDVPCDFEYVDYKPRNNCDIVINDTAIRSVQRDKKKSSCAESFVEFTDKKSLALTTAHIPKIIEPIENAGECAMFASPHGWNKGILTYGKSPTITAVGIGKHHQVLIQSYDEAKDIIKDENPTTYINKVYEVKDGLITIKDKQYPIKLADGYYIIRKLTVTECERLQTMPDGYTSKSGVSASQCYKGLGNGWTAEVIKHILSNALKDIPKDEEIVVLSMYDGIGTGRYILDSLGFTNVKYFAYEIDKYAMQIAKSNYPDIIEMGDAFAVNNPDWVIG